jgi:hypothetical protein
MKENFLGNVHDSPPSEKKFIKIHRAVEKLSGKPHDVMEAPSASDMQPELEMRPGMAYGFS